MEPSSSFPQKCSDTCYTLSMKKLLKHISVSAVVALSLALCASSQADPRTSITRTSPNHTKIVIHNTNPNARAERSARAQRAQERRERAKERAHELELARIKAGQGSTRQAKAPNRVQRQNHPPLASIQERQRRHAERNRPAPFFNGGQWTGVGGVAFAGPNFGFFNPGWGGGFYQPWQPVFHQGFRGPGFHRRGFRGAGYRGRGFRGAGYRGRGGFRGGGFRGRICR